ncbi:MAG: amidohydrolase family protein [Spirochaetales bacterium]|nr:amidohydrolase family protein [Spirochaetales bacterium]
MERFTRWKGPDLSDIPSYCAHEHWGSLSPFGGDACGFRPDTYRGALPLGDISALDILLDPYLSSNLPGSGMNHSNDPELIRSQFPELKRRHGLSGTWLTTVRGLMELYGFTKDDASEILSSELDGKVRSNYSAPFNWYERAMEQMKISHVVRAVHPLYYYRDHSRESAQAESQLIRTNLRIDPLLAFWKSNAPGKEALVELTGILPEDAPSWQLFLERLFDRAVQQGCVGIKQFQAYSRPLDFPLVGDEALNIGRNPDAADERSIKDYENWIVNACCREADRRGWTHQFHTGTHNLPDSNPLPLRRLAKRYPSMKIVMLHVWPFVDEAAFLAKTEQNIYIDACWQAVLNPRFLKKSLETWINYVPSNKIMLSHDATSVEMAAGSLLYTKEILSEVLGICGEGRDGTFLYELAKDYLYNNALRLYEV